MTFSDRVEEICREYNETRCALLDKKRSKDRYAPRDRSILEARLEAINYCLGTLGIPVVRCEGFISAFSIMGYEREVRS